jgi:hypothetical protein
VGLHGGEVIFRILSLNPTNSPVEELVRRYNGGRLDLDPPYQRGSVWGRERQVALIKSLTMGLPIGAIYINERDIMKPDVVIDGKQRIIAIRAWLDGSLAVPSDWFPSHLTKVERGMVTYGGLTVPGQRMWRNNATVTVYQTRYAGPEAEERERELFDLVNFGGLPQGSSDYPTNEGGPRERAQR